MCFEWDERYKREQAIRLSIEQAEELMKRTQESAKIDHVLEKPVTQPVHEKEDVSA
jgi:hypothetical protein